MNREVCEHFVSTDFECEKCNKHVKRLVEMGLRGFIFKILKDDSIIESLKCSNKGHDKETIRKYKEEKGI